jgi:hypothetical protein
MFNLNLHNSYKLVTKEDPMHFHKTIGIICLANYGYRYYLLLTTGNMQLNNPTAGILMCIHGALSVSSLVYHIPSKRNRLSPMIYPEFREHNILFAMRSIVCFFLHYYSFQYSVLYKMAVCYGTMFIADFITYRHQPDAVVATTTMRDMPFDRQITKTVQADIIHIQSSQQIGATLFMLGNLDSCFTPMFSIQISAFLMTLVRKNIIDANLWHLLYNLSLWSNIFCYYSLPLQYVIVYPVLFHLFYYWRFSTKKTPMQIIGNKYIGWTIIFALFYFYEKNGAFYGTLHLPKVNQQLDMLIRRTLISTYLAIYTYRSREFLVSFLPKTG